MEPMGDWGMDSMSEQPEPVNTPTADVKQAVERLEKLDDLNESRQSDGSGAAHFFGTELKEAMDRFHYDWSIVRAALTDAERERDAEREAGCRMLVPLNERISKLQMMVVDYEARLAEMRTDANELLDALAHDHQGGPPCFIGCESCDLVASKAIALSAPL